MAALEFRLLGVDDAITMLKSLPPEIVSKRGGPVKKALRKAALVILKEAKLNVAHSTESLAEDATSTKTLEQSLIAARGKPPPDQNGERYTIRVKKRFYTREGKRVSTFMTARWLEYGTEKQPAEPWLRPAGASKAAAAISTMTSELTREINRVVKKLAKQARK